MYVAAASDKQQSDSLRPTHKKSLQTPKTKSEGNQGMEIQPTKPRFFYLVGLSYLFCIKKEPMICELPHKFNGSASLRLVLW